MNLGSSAVEVEGPAADDVLTDPGRLLALEHSGLLDPPADEALDRLTRLACRLLGTPVAIISTLTADHQFVTSEHGLAEPWRSTRELPLGQSICRQVVSSGRPLHSGDVRIDPRLRPSRTADALGVTAFAGVPLIDPDGQRLGALCVLSHEPRDWSEDEIDLLGDLAGLVTTELRLRRALRAGDRQRHALAEAEALAHAGGWEWHPDTGELSVSSELRRLLGLDHGAITQGPFERLLPADERGDFCEQVRRALRPDGWWQAEHSILLDGRPRLMLSRGLARLGPDERLELLRGTMQDITDERDQAARFVAAFWGAPIGSALLGLVGVHRGFWLQANHELERMLGAAPGELDRTSVDLGVHPDDLDRTFLELDRLARGEAERTQHELRLRRFDGSWVWVLATHTVIRPAGGEAGCAMGHYVDVADRKRHEQALEHRAHHDPLTGVFNRRRFEEELARTLSRAARAQSAAAVLVFDLDGLEAINDTAGHGAGDSVLVRVAHAVGAMLRAGDAFGRIADDEFAILLPDADPAQARRVAERVIRVVGRTAAEVRPAPRGGPGVTASVGIALWDGRAASDPSHLLIAADTAMYEAKAGGGDQFALYGAPADETEGF